MFVGVLLGCKWPQFGVLAFKFASNLHSPFRSASTTHIAASFQATSAATAPPTRRLLCLRRRRFSATAWSQPAPLALARVSVAAAASTRAAATIGSSSVFRRRLLAHHTSVHLHSTFLLTRHPSHLASLVYIPSLVVKIFILVSTLQYKLYESICARAHQR